MSTARRSAGLPSHFSSAAALAGAATASRLAPGDDRRTFVQRSLAPQARDHQPLRTSTGGPPAVPPRQLITTRLSVLLILGLIGRLVLARSSRDRGRAPADDRALLHCASASVIDGSAVVASSRGHGRCCSTGTTSTDLHGIDPTEMVNAVQPHSPSRPATSRSHRRALIPPRPLSMGLPEPGRGLARLGWRSETSVKPPVS